nr:uncharacterized protein LOC105877142 isoform X2 [Microcebus murinus]XP_012630864.1 uncharacterized protein LOC105877142 isoform X2 [Microcebus murinus]XP_012630865.1 uncharacterized protein LOC105877142 isoform X2 [Microcebus murinus]XP_012630866.1 uncharacterized protein LOC105877142 isoform X2 [Microcebus murinus]XP_012630867.1 uncharacterized protein LOC105877142 isoform X2 [Microcebus murinus]XP_012630868.1 uncharacterized protein LOC105877142 isoform X2 [Microcebus murinus]XP_01263086
MMPTAVQSTSIPVLHWSLIPEYSSPRPATMKREGWNQDGASCQCLPAACESLLPLLTIRFLSSFLVVPAQQVSPPLKPWSWDILPLKVSALPTSLSDLSPKETAQSFPRRHFELFPFNTPPFLMTGARGLQVFRSQTLKLWLPRTFRMGIEIIGTTTTLGPEKCQFCSRPGTLTGPGCSPSSPVLLTSGCPCCGRRQEEEDTS